MGEVTESKYLVQAGWDDVPHLDEREKRQLRNKENLGELIRLIYVALTRAKNYCCFT